MPDTMSYAGHSQISFINSILSLSQILILYIITFLNIIFIRKVTYNKNKEINQSSKTSPEFIEDRSGTESGVGPSLLHACYCPVVGEVCSPVIEVEALRVHSGSVALESIPCHALKHKAYIVTVNIYAAFAGVHSSTQKQPKVASLSPLCLSQT